MKDTLYDILTYDGKRLYNNMANDEQCQMYFWPESNGFITYDQIDEHNWIVIESGNYDEIHCRVGT